MTNSCKASSPLARVRTAAALVLTLVLLLLPAARAAAEVTLAILPFEVNAQDKLDYLREGLCDMLSSRLGANEAISVIGRDQLRPVLVEGQKMTPDKARALAAKLGAKGVLYGSLTVIGNGLSLDATLIEASGAQKSFYAEGQGLEALIPKVTEISSQVSVALTGVPLVQQAAAPAPKPAALAVSQPSAPVVALAPVAAAGLAAPAVQAVQNAAQGTAQGTLQGAAETATKAVQAPVVQAAATPPPPAAASIVPVAVSLPSDKPGATKGGNKDESGVWRSRLLPIQARGMALGDIDGDGRQEIVLLDGGRLLVYRLESGQLVELYSYEFPRATDCLSVDAADVKGGGRAQIYVTALRNKQPASFVLELEGSRLVKTADDIEYYLRAVNYPGQGPVLMGQKMDYHSAFKPGIYRMRWSGKALEPDELLSSDSRVNVYSILPVKREDRLVTVALLSDDYLHVFNGKDEEWRSADYFGGSNLFVETYPRSIPNEEPMREYLPQRLVGVDGGRYIAVVAHKGTVSHWLARYKNYTSGEVKLLAWNPQGLSEAWVSPVLDGYICDIAVGDIDGDGHAELVAAVVGSGGWNPLASSKTGLVVFRLP